MFFKSPKTVDAAIAPLLKAQIDLIAVFHQLSDTIISNRTIIAELQAEIDNAKAECVRAEKIIETLNNITDPKE